MSRWLMITTMSFIEKQWRKVGTISTHIFFKQLGPHSSKVLEASDGEPHTKKTMKQLSSILFGFWQSEGEK